MSLGVLRNRCMAETISSAMSRAVAGGEDEVVLPADMEVEGEK